MALFITFEGGEGSGKSTQARRLAERLRAAGVDVTEMREPGSTRLGRLIRDWLKQGLRTEETMSHNTELFLFAAARSELVTKVLRPVMGRPDAVIVSDRYADSTIAYQGYGRRIPLEDVEAVNDLATQGVEPALTILLDCDPVVGLRRVGAFQMRLPLERGADSGPARRDEEGTRFEEEPLEFHERIRKGYLELATRHAQRWQVLDADRPARLIAREVLSMVKHRLSPGARELVDASAALETARPGPSP